MRKSLVTVSRRWLHLLKFHFRSDAAALGGANYILQNLTQILSRASGFSPLTHHLARLRGEAIASGRANAYTSLRVIISTDSRRWLHLLKFHFHSFSQ